MSIVTKSLQLAAKFLHHKKPIVFPSDTLYGILADALAKHLVDKVYLIKKRSPSKPYIILIKDLEDLQIFDVSLSKKEKELLKLKGISVLLSLKSPDRFGYLHRGTGKLAFRIPDDPLTLKLLKMVNRPLIAPSANPEGKPPARSIDEAYRYFTEKIPVYFDWGFKKNTTPSSLIYEKEGKIVFLRKGRKFEEIEKLSTNYTFGR